MEHFGTYSDQVERIQLKESKALAVIYSKIEKQKQKESGGKASSGSTGSKKKKGKKTRKLSKRVRSMKGGYKNCGGTPRSRRIVIGQAILQPK